jgi:hypothetical protein
MPESALTPAIREEVKRLGSADIMVGIPSFRSAATIGHVVRAAQAGLVQYFPDLRPLLVNADAGSSDDTQRVVVETEPPGYVEEILLVHPRNRLTRISLTYPAVAEVMGKGAALRTLFEMAAELEVQALVVVDSDLRSIVPEWIELLAGPILKGGYDFVSPLYARHKYDGTITNTLTYPVTRALYGRRIRQPIGGDFGVGADLVRHYLAQESWTPEVSRFGIDIWMTTTALTGGFAVCQSRLGAKIHDPKDPGTDLGPMFRQVVGTMMALACDNAPRWLEITGSHDVPAYGFERYADPPALEIDTLRLLSQFHAGSLTAAETWGKTFTAAHLARVTALAAEAGETAEAAAHRLGLAVERETADTGATGPIGTDDLSDAVAGFHFPDELWARLFYDLLVASSFGDVPDEQLVAAFTPVYFGRVGSHVIENRRLSGEQAEERVERQAREFEAQKPYLVERWREGGGQ